MRCTRSNWVYLIWLNLTLWGLVICAAPSLVLDHQNHQLVQRSAQLSGVLSGLGGLLGGAVSGLGNTVGGLTSGLGTTISGVPLLGGLLDGTASGLGSAVSGLGNGLGGTVSGILGASSHSPTPSPKPLSPSKPPQPKPTLRPSPSAPPEWQGDQGGEARDEDQRGRGNGDRGKKSLLSVITVGGDIFCRAYADTISTDPPKLSVFRSGTKLEVTCYTRSGMDGASGTVRGDSTWLKTSQGCFVNRIEVQRREDFEKVLNFCPAPPHWVGILMAQYSRVDCYSCTSLDCPSRNIGSPPYVDLACSLQGESVLGNSTWMRTQEQNCYIPGSAFSQYGWLGSPGGRC